jgi:AcrR family transcriptional regulator
VTRAKRKPSTAAAASKKTTRQQPEKLEVKRYHHGSLRDGLLRAAEQILVTEGLEALTLRAAARAAGVSHAAPMNHFGDLCGLLSALAAVGFRRLREALVAAGSSNPASQQVNAIGRAYVAFAVANPALFLLMFRSERLDFERPELRHASGDAFGQLTAIVGQASDTTRALSMKQAAGIAAAWATVHGLAMLAIDGRLKPLVARLPKGADETVLFDAILGPKG